MRRQYIALHGNHLQCFIQLVIEFFLHADRFDDVHIDDLIFMDTDDAVADAVLQKTHRLVAELRCQHSVRHGRRSAALDMPDRRAAHGIGRHRLQTLGKFVCRRNTFRKDDNVGMFPVRTAAVDAAHHVLHIIGDFGNNNDLRAARNTRMQSNIAAATPHDFHDADALVRGHRVAQLIDDVETGVHGGIEAERVIGIFEVVVDRAGNADRGNAVLVAEAFRPLERTVAADDDKPLDAVLVQRVYRLLLPFDSVHFDAARRPKHGAAALHDIGNTAHFHRNHIVRNQPGITLPDSIDLHSEILCRTHNRTDTGIHAGRIAAAR